MRLGVLLRKMDDSNKKMLDWREMEWRMKSRVVYFKNSDKKY